MWSSAPERAAPRPFPTGLPLAGLAAGSGGAPQKRGVRSCLLMTALAKELQHSVSHHSVNCCGGSGWRWVEGKRQDLTQQPSGKESTTTLTRAADTDRWQLRKTARSFAHLIFFRSSKCLILNR